MKKILRNKWLIMPLVFVSILAIGDLIVVFSTHGKSEGIGIVPLGNPVAVIKTNQIKVMAANMAHGRGDGKNQILQSDDFIKSNVASIGRLIAREEVQIAALQEADAPSWWSGDFSHVNTVGELGGMASAIQGLNVNGLGLGYGAAIVTQLEAINGRQVTFEKSIPTFSKGFVAVTCEWPGDSGFRFDVVSVHLDFASSGVREKQLSALTRFIKEAGRPIIVMGDFNTDMSRQLLPAFLKENQLNTWKADDNTIVTRPVSGTRIDWILVSQEFHIVEQTVLDDILSDHSFLTAVIKKAL